MTLTKRRLIANARRALQEEILESLEVRNDSNTSKALKEGLSDLKAGRVRPYREFADELRGSHEL